MIKTVYICDKCGKECEKLFGNGTMYKGGAEYVLFYREYTDFDHQLYTELCEACFEEMQKELKAIVEKYKIRKHTHEEKKWGDL